MSGLWATYLRELRAFFVSPLAYVVLAFFLLVNGCVFAAIVFELNRQGAPGDLTPMKLFLGNNIFFWFVLITTTPLLTMRLVAEERRQGTLEMLMTAPVSETQVILGKFLAAVTFYAFLWLPTLAYAVITARYSELDWGPVMAGYLGVLCLGALAMALGILGSTFSRNQISAALFTLALLLLIMLMSFLQGLASSDTAQQILQHVDLIGHMDDFGKGVIDTRRLVFYASATALLLFVSSRVLAAKKWR